MKKLLMLTALLFVGAQGKVNAQLPKMEGGKPSKEEMALVTYEPEPDANAVILCATDNVYYEVTNGNLQVFTEVRRRVKILKAEGKDMANHSISTYQNSTMRERVLSLKAVAYNMVGNKLVETKMKREQVFEEKVDENHRLTKFTIPQVKEGTIIEYSYTFVSDFYSQIDVWYAQHSVPTLYAEYKVSIPDWFTSNVSSRGYEKLERTMADGSFRIMAGSQTNSSTASDVMFVGRNLPSIKGDDFVYNVNDYRTQVNVELSGVRLPGLEYRDFSSTWNAIDKTLQDDYDFGGRIKGGSPWKKEIVAAGIDKLESRDERISKVCEMLRSRVKWNGDYGVTANSGASVVKSGMGSSSDMNFLLLSMLYDAGIEAEPVVLSRRDRRAVSVAIPSLSGFNAVVVRVIGCDDKVVYLDASHRDGYVGTLPTRMLVNYARVIPKHGDGQWVDLSKASSGKMHVDVSGRLSAEGDLEAVVTTSAMGCSAADMRRSFREAKDSAAYIGHYADEFGGTVEEAKLVGFDQFANSVTRTLKLKKSLQVDGDIIYLNPMIFPQMTQNPFTSETRRLPVQFPYIESIVQTVNIEIPEGYELAEMPKPISAYTTDGKINLKMMVNQRGNSLSTTYTFAIKDLLFLPQDYDAIRSIFATLVNKNTENVVLKKKVVSADNN